MKSEKVIMVVLLIICIALAVTLVFRSPDSNLSQRIAELESDLFDAAELVGQLEGTTQRFRENERELERRITEYRDSLERAEAEIRRGHSAIRDITERISEGIAIAGGYLDGIDQQARIGLDIITEIELRDQILAEADAD